MRRQEQDVEEELLEDDEEALPLLSLPTMTTFQPQQPVLAQNTAMVGDALHKAALAQDTATLRRLIAAGASVGALDSAGRTALHLCIEHKLLEPFQVLLSAKGATDVPDSRGLPVLHEAVKHSWREGVHAALTAGADVTAIRPIMTDQEFYEMRRETNGVDLDLNCPQTPIHLALESDDMAMLEEILNVAKKRGVINCPNQAGKTPLYRTIQLGYILAIRSLLDRGASVHPDGRDTCNNTALHVAIKENQCDVAFFLLMNASIYKLYLSDKGCEGRTAVEMIATNFVEPSNFFKRLFDENIYEQDTSLLVNYNMLTSIEGESQIKILEEFVRCNQSSVLKHPLIESLLYLKWKPLCPVFYFMMLLYAVFLVTFNIFVLLIHEGNSNRTVNMTSNDEMWCGFGRCGGWDWFLVALIYIFIFLLFGQELFFIKLKRLHYFTYLESWVRLCGLTLGALTPAVVRVEGDWPRHVTSIAVLIAWLQVMFLLARIPRWGNYGLMFGKVAKTMLKIFGTTIFPLIGFALFFMIEFRSEAPFDKISAFVKTLTMMSSEFDYSDLFCKNHGDEQDCTTRLFVLFLFTLFVIFVAITLMNFITGVAVSDINELNLTSEIMMLEKQLESLSTLDAIPEFMKTRSTKYHSSIEFAANSQSDWLVFVDGEDCSDNNYVSHISYTLRNNIIEILNKNKQRTHKDNKDNTFRNKIEAMCNDMLTVVNSSNLPILQEMKKQEEQTKSLAVCLIDVQEEIKRCLKEKKDFSLSRQELKRQNEQIKLLADSLIDVRQEIKSCNQNFQKLANDMAVIKEMLLNK